MPREDLLIPKTDGTVELTTENTAYQVPDSDNVQTVPSQLVIYNPSTASIMVRASSGTDSGDAVIQTDSRSYRLAPNQKIYVYSSVALQTINFSIFKIA